ncbi:ATP/GTP-binding protein [Streptomyces sp. NPDC020096]
MPCSDPDFGSYYNHCYYKAHDPQPPKSDPAWEGHTNGAIYDATCPDSVGGAGTGTGMQWLANPPGGAAVDPAQLAQQAISKMRLDPPDIQINPKPGGRGLVGMPVWMWVGKSATTWGPESTSASAGGITVTATASVSQVVWDMGDGNSVTCTSAGTPYDASYGKQSSPDCGYQYTQPSSQHAGGTYPVKATSTWAIHWAGGGQQGDLTETRTAQVQVTIAELQVLN